MRFLFPYIRYSVSDNLFWQSLKFILENKIMSGEITENAGPCGKFRFVVEPSIKVGVITLQRDFS